METTGGVGQSDAKGIGERFVPIGDYGFLSDGEAIALVSPGGSVDWMCLPRFDSPSVFGAILGPARRQSFRVAPSDVTVPAARRYLPGTMILETSWGTATGWIIVRDALADRPVAPRGATCPARSAAPRPTTRPSTSCCARSAASPARCRPSSSASPVLDYGRRTPRWDYTEHGLSPGRSPVPTGHDPAAP